MTREQVLEAALQGILAAVTWDDVRDRPMVHLDFNSAELRAAARALGEPWGGDEQQAANAAGIGGTLNNDQR